MNQAWKIRAGEFLPGANLTVLPHWERKAAPVYERAEVSVPGRLHFAVFDFLQMAPGLGGGGLGVSTSTVGHQVIVSKTSAGNGGWVVPNGRPNPAPVQSTLPYDREYLSITPAPRLK